MEIHSNSPKLYYGFKEFVDYFTQNKYNNLHERSITKPWAEMNTKQDHAD